MKRKILCVLLTIMMLLALMPAAVLSAAAKPVSSYTEFIIMHSSNDPANYRIYATTDGDVFDLFKFGADAEPDNNETPRAYSTIGGAISAITGTVGTGAATLYFGEAGSTDVIDIGEDHIDLGDSGTYTIKGSLTGCPDAGLLTLAGVSVVIDGATIESTGTYPAISCDDWTVSGSVTIKDNSTVQNTNAANGGHAIYLKGYEMDIQGGTVYSKGRIAVYCSSDLTVSGDSTQVKTDSTDDEAIMCGTAEIQGGTISSKGGDAVNANDLTVTGGSISSESGAALFLEGGTSSISGGTITTANTKTTMGKFDHPGAVCSVDQTLNISGGTITNTAESGYGVYNVLDEGESTCALYLSGTPAISGPTVDIATDTVIHANDGGETPAAYAGGALDIEYIGSLVSGTVVVDNVTNDNKSSFNITNSDCTLELDGTDLVLKAPVPVYVISKGETSATDYYYIRKGTEDSDSYDAFVDDADADAESGSAYSTLGAAVTAVTTDVAGGAATVYFGETGFNPEDLSGTLDAGDDDEVTFSGSGTYTLKGALTRGSDAEALPTLGLSDSASLIIDGATIDNEIYSKTFCAVGSGDVTIKSGTVQNTYTPNEENEDEDIYAILVNGNSLYISGGTVYCKNGYAVYNIGQGETVISGENTQVKSDSTRDMAIMCAYLEIQGGTVSGKSGGVFGYYLTISGGTVTEARARRHYDRRRQNQRRNDHKRKCRNG